MPHENPEKLSFSCNLGNINLNCWELNAPTYTCMVRGHAPHNDILTRSGISCNLGQVKLQI